MTITYSLDVANTRFFGFAKLLGRWKGSIYKILWKEFLVFVAGYCLLSFIYRFALTGPQKKDFEMVVIYFEEFIELIPLSFVLGFYVSLVIGRWWQQYDAIPWPDRMCYMIGTYVHGVDERSRMIRRTLGRYLILLMALAFQSVSPAVKKRFPTTGHLVSAGLMTKEERTIFEKLEAPYGKWWLPAQWFSALIMRAKKEGRIKDSILMDGLFREFVLFRSACGTMFNYDWISVPLVYTQVVTLATYTYSVALMVGRQYLDPKEGYHKHKVDLYIPIFTLLQFFFYVGWLKVAEQIVNPYGEDEDDFELNTCLDRSSQVVYLLVDHFHAKHPKLRKDRYWDDMLPALPQTRITSKSVKNPQLGSAFNLEVDPADAEFLPMDTLLEEDSDANMYPSDSVKQTIAGVRHRPSFLMNLFNSSIGQSIRRRSTYKQESFKDIQGHINPAFSHHETSVPPKGSTPTQSRKSSMAKRASPAHSRTSSISFHPSSISRHRQKFYDANQAETNSLANGSIPECEGIVSAMNAAMAPVVANFEDDVIKICDKTESKESENMPKLDIHMPSIPEEPSRVVSTISTSTERSLGDGSTKQLDDVQNLVAEASKVLEELNRVVTAQGHKMDCEMKGYESCCSLGSDDSSDEDEIESDGTADEEDLKQESYEKDSIAIDMSRNEAEQDDRKSSVSAL